MAPCRTLERSPKACWRASLGTAGSYTIRARRIVDKVRARLRNYPRAAQSNDTFPPTRPLRSQRRPRRRQRLAVPMNRETSGSGSLYYDGECAFCRRQVERLRRRVGEAVRFEPYQSAGHVPGVQPRELARAIHFVDADGRVSSGAEAIYRALASGGHTTRLWMYRHVPGFGPLSELGYRVIARHRGLIGRILPRI